MAAGLGEVVALRTEVARVTSSLDPALLATAGAVVALEHLTAIERMAATARVALAAKVAETEQWRRTGYRSPQEWLAAKTGTSTQQAAQQLAVGKRLADQPVLAQALKSGELSVDQARLVSDAAAADPSAERRLVEQARRASLGELREKCDGVKAAADPSPEATHERVRAGRRLKRWRNPDGSWCLYGSTVPEDGVVLNAAIDPIADELLTRDRLAGKTLSSPEAYTMDALVELARRSLGAPATPAAPPPGRTRRARAKAYLAQLRVDVTALQRGRVEDDELCEIPGVGPVPVSVAKAIIGDAAVELVIAKGVDVQNLTYLGRGPTVAQKHALLFADPLCTVEGCGRPIDEFDHRDSWAHTKVTTVSGLDGHCGPHHDRKTYDGWALVPGTGRRPMLPPDDPRHPKNLAPPGGDPGTRQRDDPTRSSPEAPGSARPRSRRGQRAAGRLERQVRESPLRHHHCDARALVATVRSVCMILPDRSSPAVARVPTHRSVVVQPVEARRRIAPSTLRP